MKSSPRFVFLVALLFPGLTAFAQVGPELKKLDSFVGKWRTEVEFKGASPSKASGTEDCEWFANMHVVCRSELTGPAGLYRSMRVISYVPALKQYAVYTVDSIGYAMLTMGTSSGNSWTFSSAGQGWKTRLVMRTSADGLTSTSDYAGADGKWVTTATGKSTRLR
jgi:hypothetical protein